MAQSFIRSGFILIILILLLIPSLSQEQTPVVDVSYTPSPSQTPTLILDMADITPEVTVSPTASATATASMTPSPSLEFTEELTVPAAEITLAVEETVTVEITESAEITEATIAVELTEVPEITEMATVVEITENAEITEVATTVEITESAEITEIVVSPNSTITPTATPGGIALQVIRGEVHFQNRPTHAGINIMVLSVDEILLSVSQTNERGIFTIPAPEQEGFFLLVQAPLHRELRVWFEDNSVIQSFVLAGGDLNDDGCINQLDLDRMLANYDQMNSPQSDINLDGITDLADLAILTGNFEASCAASLLPEATSETIGN